MKAMDCISSKNICYLICDILKLIDRHPVEHGGRVAYMLYKMLQCKGGYEEYEMAELAFLAMIHDLGAYKTENLSEKPAYEHKNCMPHSVYGCLFLKYVTPMERQSKVLLYHHMDYSKLKGMNYEFLNIAMYINLLENIDVFSTTLKDKFDYRVLEKKVGSRYAPEALVLFSRCAGRDHILEKVRSGEYRRELDEIMDNIIFTNEEKRSYLAMAMYCMGLKSEHRIVDAITCACIAEEIGIHMHLADRDRENIYYAVLLHDVGMLAVPDSIIKQPRALTVQEMNRVKRHVAAGEKILRNRFQDQSVVDIAVSHHERGDGSGYPKGRKESQMEKTEKIVQLADMVTGMLNRRSYRNPRKKEEIVQILQEEMEHRRLDRAITETFLTFYDEIMAKVKVESKEYLLMHMRLHNQYKQINGNNDNNMMGENEE